MNGLTARHFEALAEACHHIEDGLRAQALPKLTEEQIDRTMELVVARIAWVCAGSNPRFDSFRFNAACRKRRT